jgi:hypothetical protein
MLSHTPSEVSCTDLLGLSIQSSWQWSVTATSEDGRFPPLPLCTGLPYVLSCLVWSKNAHEDTEELRGQQGEEYFNNLLTHLGILFLMVPQNVTRFYRWVAIWGPRPYRWTPQTLFLKVHQFRRLGRYGDPAGDPGMERGQGQKLWCSLWRPRVDLVVTDCCQGLKCQKRMTEVWDATKRGTGVRGSRAVPRVQLVCNSKITPK